MRMKLGHCLYLIGFVLILGCIVSCGSSSKGGSNSDKLLSTNGTVVLPEGFAIAPASLTVSSPCGKISVGTDRSFTVSEPSGGGPATVNLIDPASGKLVMLGHVDTDNPSFNDISPMSTAEELLFISTTSNLLPASEWINVYTFLAAAPETATLAGVIATRLAVNPTALGDADTEISDAVSEATASLLAREPAKASGHSLATGRVAEAEIKISSDSGSKGVSEGAISVKVNSPNPDMLTVAPSQDNKGIDITNHARIHFRYFVYRSGYIPAGGKLTDVQTHLATWTLVKEGYLPAITGATGVVSSLIDYFTKKTFWGPTSTPTIALPQTPTDAVANFYRVFVVGTGGPVDPPSDLKDEQASAYESVKKAHNDMIALEFMKEFMWPILSKGLPSKINPKLWSDPESIQKWVGLFNQLMKDLGSVATNYTTQLEKGEMLPAYFDLIKTAASDPTVKKALKNMFLGMMEAALSARGPDDAYENMDKMLTALGNILKPADLALTSLDEASILYDLYHTTDYNDWDVQANAMSLILVPPTSNISSPEQTATFSVTVSGYASSDLTYQWGPATYGKFTGCGKTKQDVLTCDGDQVATYSLTGTTLPTTSEPFEVEVFDPHKLSLGIIHGTVTFDYNPWVGTWRGAQTSSKCEGACASAYSQCGFYVGPLNVRIASAGGNLLNYSYVSNGPSGSYQLRFNGNTAVSLNGTVTFNMTNNGNTISTPNPNGCGGTILTKQ